MVEVESFEGVGRGVMGLIRLWKCVEKSEDPGAKPSPGGSGQDWIQQSAVYEESCEGL